MKFKLKTLKKIFSKLGKGLTCEIPSDKGPKYISIIGPNELTKGTFKAVKNPNPTFDLGKL